MDNHELLVQLRQCAHYLRHHTYAKGSQERILLIINHHHDMTQRQLMNEVKIRSSSLSEVLKKIEDNEYIVRFPSKEDKRNMIINITPKGEKEVENIKIQHAKMEKNLFSMLEDEEKETLSKLLNKLLAGWE